MRSNGAVHLGNDTFLAATRDSADSLYLFTSSFTKDERLAPLPLARRARFFPSSSLDFSEADMARCVAAFDRLQAARANQSQPKGKRAFDIDVEAAIKAGKLVLPATKNPVKTTLVNDNGKPPGLLGLPRSQGSADKGHYAEESAPVDDKDASFLLRHSTHVSCDGQRVAAISNGHRQHYVLDVAHDPVNVADFETEEVVRSAVWHPTVPHLLLLLSVTGVLTVYDTAGSHLGVVFQRAQQTDLKPMLSVLLRDKDLLVQQQLQQRHFPVKSEEKKATAGKAKKPAEGQAAAGEEETEAAFPRKGGARSSSSSGVSSPWPAAASARASPGAAGSMPSSPVAATSEGAAHARLSSLVKAGKHNTTGLYTLDEFGLPVKADAGKNAKDTSSSVKGVRLLADIQATFVSKKDNSTLRRPASNPELEQTATPAPEKPGQLTVAGGDPVCASNGISRVSSTVFRGALQHRGRGTLLPTGSTSPPPKALLLRTAAEARALVPLHDEDDTSFATTTSIDLVDMCVVSPSLSLPPTLLLLSSCGDVFSVKLNPYCLPAMGKAVAPDGSVPLTEAAAKAAEEAQRMLGRMPHLCHVVQGNARKVRVPKERQDAVAGGEDTAEACEQEEEAVAISSCRLDDDTGIHAIIVVYASGVVRGAWVDEADLIARQRVSSSTLNFAKYGASSFTIHLGSGVDPRSFLSPPVPTTTHTVQLTCQDNVLLLRMGGGDGVNEAAYLIAFPVIDRYRKGWSYWCPRKLVGTEARLKESLRLPLVSTEPTVPEPLALRVPFAVSGASVTIGATELILFPEMAAPTRENDCARTTVVTVKVASLLRVALYARSVGVETTPSSWRLPGENNGLSLAVERMFTCSKVFLCGQPAENVDNCTASLAALVEGELAATRIREEALQERQSRLSERIAALQSRISGVVTRVEGWTVTLLDAIAHRRGVEAVQTANQRLGLAHGILTEQEGVVADWRRQSRQTQEQQ